MSGLRGLGWPASGRAGASGPVRGAGAVGRVIGPHAVAGHGGWPGPGGHAAATRLGGRSCPQMWWWCLCSGGGLIGCDHGLEHPFDQPPGQNTDQAGGVFGAGGRAPGAGRPRPGPAGRRRPGRAGPGVGTAGRAPGRPLAGRARRPGCPGGRRRRGGRPGRLDRRLAAGPAAHECRCGRQLCADRPGAVPRPPHRHRPGPGRGGHLPSPRPGARPRHPGSPRPHHRRGRTSAAGGRAAA